MKLKAITGLIVLAAMLMVSNIARYDCSYTVWWKTFEGENIHEYHSFRATRESFLHEFGSAVPTYDRFWRSAKVFSAKWSLLTNP